jgi:HlyD family secretion protein
MTFSCPDLTVALLPGYSADAEIILEVHEDVLRVPSEAVIEGPKVLVLGADGMVEERGIETGIVNWKHSEVVSGLSAGDRVVLSVNRDGVVAGARAVAQHGATAGER